MRPKKMSIGRPSQLPPPAATLEQQRQRVADLIGKLLARHWLAERGGSPAAKTAPHRGK